jgi:hypothetical protein
MLARLVHPYFILVIFVVALTYSCNEKIDYKHEIHSLDSVIVEVKNVQAAQASIFPDSLGMINDSITAHLKYVQENFVGTMKPAMAETLHKYGSLRTEIAGLGEYAYDIMSPATQVAGQLEALRKALAEGATHDAKENKLTGENVKTALGNETKAAGELKEHLEEIKTKWHSVHSKYLSLYPEIKHWVDSIPEKKNKK